MKKWLTVLCGVAAFVGLLALAGAQVPGPGISRPSLLGRASLAGDTEDPASRLSPSAKGALELVWPYQIPTNFEPILLSPLPTYSTQAGVSRWGKGWTEPYYVEAEALEGAPSVSWFKERLRTPWGRFVRGTDGYWYPTAMTTAVRAKAVDNDLIFYLADGIEAKFTRDAIDTFTKKTFRWRLADAHDDRNNVTRYFWEKSPNSAQDRLQFVDFGSDPDTRTRVRFWYRAWGKQAVLSGGRAGTSTSLNDVVEKIEVRRGNHLLETQLVTYFDTNIFWFPVIKQIERTTGTDKVSEQYEYYQFVNTPRRGVNDGAVINRRAALETVPLDVDLDGRSELVSFGKKRAYRIELGQTPPVKWWPLPMKTTPQCAWDELAKPARMEQKYLAGRFDRSSPLQLLRLVLQKCGGGPANVSAGNNCMAVTVCSVGGAVNSSFEIPLGQPRMPDLRGAQWVDIDRDARPDVVVFGSVDPQSGVSEDFRGLVHVFRTRDADASASPPIQRLGSHEILASTSGGLVKLNPAATHQILDYNSDGLPDLVDVTRGGCGEKILARVTVRYGTGDPVGFTEPWIDIVPHIAGRERRCARWENEITDQACTPLLNQKVADHAVGFLRDLDADGSPDYVGVCTDGLALQYKSTTFDGKRPWSVTWQTHALPIGRSTSIVAMDEFFDLSQPSVTTMLLADNRPHVLGGPMNREFYGLAWGNPLQGLLKKVTSSTGTNFDVRYTLDARSQQPLVEWIVPHYKGYYSQGRRTSRKLTYTNPVYDGKTGRLWGFGKVTSCAAGAKPCDIAEHVFFPEEDGVPRLKKRSVSSKYVSTWTDYDYEKSSLAGVSFHRLTRERSGWKSSNSSLVSSKMLLKYEEVEQRCIQEHGIIDPLRPSSVVNENEHGTVRQTICYRRPQALSRWLATIPTSVKTVETATDGTTRETLRHFEYYNVGNIHDKGRLKRDWSETNHKVANIGSCQGSDPVEHVRVDQLHPNPLLAYPMRIGSHGLAATVLERPSASPQLISRVTYPDGTDVATRSWDPMYGLPTELVVNEFEHQFTTYDPRGRPLKSWSPQRGESASSPGLERWYRDARGDGIDIVESALRLAPSVHRREIALSGAEGAHTIAAEMEQLDSGVAWRWSPLYATVERSMGMPGLDEHLPQLIATKPAAPTVVSGSPGSRAINFDDLSESTARISWSWATPTRGGRQTDKTTDSRHDIKVTLRANDLLVVTRRASSRTNAHAGSEFVELYPSGLVKRRTRGNAVANYSYYPSGDVRRIEIKGVGTPIVVELDSDLVGRLHQLHRSDVGGYRRCYADTRAGATEWADRDKNVERTEEYTHDSLGRRIAIKHSLPAGTTKTYRLDWDCSNLPVVNRTVGCRGKLSGVTGPDYQRTWKYDDLGRAREQKTTLAGEDSVIAYEYGPDDTPTKITYGPAGTMRMRKELVIDVSRDPTGHVAKVVASMGPSKLAFSVVRGQNWITVATPKGEFGYGLHPSTRALLDIEWMTNELQAKHRIAEFRAGYVAGEVYEWNSLKGEKDDIRQRTFTYDENQRLRAVGGTGRKEFYEYLADGRPRTLKQGARTRKWQRNLTSTASDDGRSFLRDKAGKVTEQRMTEGVPWSLFYSYGPDGLVEFVKNEDGKPILQVLHDENGMYLGARRIEATGQPSLLVDDEALDGVTMLRWPLVIEGRLLGYLRWSPGVITASTLRFEPVVTDLRGSRFLVSEKTPLEPSAFGELEDGLLRAKPLFDASFVGRQWLADTKAVQMPFRAYLPEAGEFLSADPLIFEDPDSCVQDLSRCFAFQYTFNNVISYADASGLEECHTVPSSDAESPVTECNYDDDEIVAERHPLPVPEESGLVDRAVRTWNDARAAATEALFDRAMFDRVTAEYGDSRVADNPYTRVTDAVVRATPSAATTTFSMFTLSLNTKFVPPRPPGPRFTAGVVGNIQQNTRLGHRMMNELTATGAAAWAGTKRVLQNRTWGTALGQKALGVFRNRPDSLVIGESGITAIEILSPSNNLRLMMMNSLKVMRAAGAQAEGTFILRPPTMP